MTRALLMVLLSVIRALIVSPVPSCPVSCVVCSEEAIICHRLAHIIDAPDTTQALLLTEGSISTVRPASLSELNNITVIGLSHNHISMLGQQSFRKLPFLHTLLLDHNHLTSQALQERALTNLTQLEVLALGHNFISMIQGDWFRGNTALRSLKLEGNLLTSIDAQSFPLNDLRDLESLDLSDNLIDHLEGNSFDGLVSLHTLDLSRNHLNSAPVEAFSYLTWLTNLNLDLNTWNCSCQLLELATFLSNFIQQPDKTLYNGRRMVCVSADNPSVTTVLELTEANCVPSNQNITVQIETRGSVTPQMYARDLAITAVICFIGGVALTLLVVLIYHHIHQRKTIKESKKQKEEEEGNSTVAHHHVNHIDSGEKGSDLLMQANGRKPWERGDMMFSKRSDGYEGQVRPRDEETSSHFRCPDCRTVGLRGTEPNMVRWNNRMNGGMEPDEDRERRRMRVMSEEERQKSGLLSRDVPNRTLPHGNTSSFSHPLKETISQGAETTWADMEVKSRGLETLHCEKCHRMFRPPEQNVRQGRNHRDSAPFDGFPSQYRQIDRSNNLSHDRFDRMNHLDLRRETRIVTFDLQRSRTREQRNGQDEDHHGEGEETFRDKERGRDRKHKARVQSSQLLRVKLNLNPLKKSKVHPKRKNESGNTERSSPKKSKEKRQNGKEQEDEDENGGSRKDKMGSNRRAKKSSKTKGREEDGEGEKEGEEREEGKKSKKSSAQKKSSSKEEQDNKESIEADQGESNTGNSTLGITNNTNQTGFPSTIGQGLSMQYQGAGLVLGSSYPSLSLAATNRNQTTNLSLLGPAGSQLSGSSLSLQGGNFLLNNSAQRSAAQFPGGLAAPSTAVSGLSMAPGGTSDSFPRQAVAGVIPSATSLQANTVHANSLQTGAMHTLPPHPSQTAGPTSSLSTNSLQSHQPLENSPPVEKHNSDQLLLESQTIQTKESLTPATQAPPSIEGLTGVTPQAPAAMITVDNPNSKNQPETSPVPSLIEGPAAGVSSDVPASAVSAQSVSSMSDAVSAPALLQQEYLSEEGGSSPRRKLRLVLPEKTSSRPPTALERKIR